MLNLLSDALFALSIGYFLAVNGVYFILLIAAFISIRLYTLRHPRLEGVRRPVENVAPPVTVIAPAYNEELSIVQSTRSFLMLDYPKHEVIVVNDGSKDATLARLVEAFGLAPVDRPPAFETRLSKAEIRGVYASEAHPNLLVVDKVNGGKADALNVGIEWASSDFFCAVDADSILEDDALLKIALPFVHDPEGTLASGGTVRVVNGSDVRHGRVERPRIPRAVLPLLQMVEYLRAFLFGRVGWNSFQATLIISGAFGLFNRKAIAEVGGYREGSLGEDIELVVRLHKRHAEGGRRHIVFVPDPVCWTEVPSDLATLGRQRDRWQRGLADTLSRHRSMLFNPRYGLVGLWTFPYFFFVELWGPVIELVAYGWVVGGSIAGVVDISSLALFFVVSVFFGVINSVAAVLVDEASYSRYSSTRELLVLFLVAVLENFGYRQLTTWWRLRGLMNHFRGAQGWGTMKRKGFGTPGR